MILGIIVKYLGILMLLWFCIRRIIPTFCRNTEIFTDSIIGIYLKIIWAQGRVDETMLTAIEWDNGGTSLYFWTCLIFSTTKLMFLQEVSYVS